MAKLGIPNGLSVLIEVTSFTLMALFIARLGTLATASHQVAANMTALIYMVPLSFSIAISARLSYWKGAGHIENMHRVIKFGMDAGMMLRQVFVGTTVLAAMDLSRIIKLYNPLGKTDAKKKADIGKAEFPLPACTPFL
jgi:MATE family multidrug resistance protein